MSWREQTRRLNRLALGIQQLIWVRRQRTVGVRCLTSPWSLRALALPTARSSWLAFPLLILFLGACFTTWGSSINNFGRCYKEFDKLDTCFLKNIFTLNASKQRGDVCCGVDRYLFSLNEGTSLWKQVTLWKQYLVTKKISVELYFWRRSVLIANF